MSDGFKVDVKNLFIKDGHLTQPDITVTFEGDSSTAVNGRCYLKLAPGGFLYAQAGFVPVFWKPYAILALQVSLSKASHFRASIGTEGGSLDSDDVSFTVTPQFEFGVNFYGVVSGYVGMDFPVKTTEHTPCSPSIEASAVVKAGIQAGLLEIPGLPINKALGVEISSPALGPWTWRESVCN